MAKIKANSQGSGVEVSESLPPRVLRTRLDFLVSSVDQAQRNERVANQHHENLRVCNKHGGFNISGWLSEALLVCNLKIWPPYCNGDNKRCYKWYNGQSS